LSPTNPPSERSPLYKGARSDVRVVAKGGATQITGQLMQGGLSFIFVAIAVRILGTAHYGLVRQAVQALAIVGLGLADFNYSAMRLQLGLAPP
jgi:O-antigen/teichoic acid export membrane protein